MAILTSLMLADTDYPTHKTDMIQPYSARSKSPREQFDCEITIHTLQFKSKAIRCIILFIQSVNSHTRLVQNAQLESQYYPTINGFNISSESSQQMRNYADSPI
ncbi:hypothetical protein CDAR_574041 [Caerostris darwini]|uniref:Uncharacterized protein n=1 Tax=Caerostris darwini TaxID=1538125 RepID=A0AAV4T3K5_9ARAC|nr:hypothetical protein CDAR_574041 [Caerostris darwini]